MTTLDRELLELAAKAAGADWVHGRWMVLSDGVWCSWNPLEDDGDALRLAVALGLRVQCRGLAVHVDYPVRIDGCVGVLEWHDRSDPQTAARRAIVRAAAEIGRTL